MSLTESLYAAALGLVRAASPLAARGESKLARGIRARRGAAERLERWADQGRDASRPLAWFHAPSVGEGLQACAVLEALRELRPDLQTAFTHFSPSAEGLATRVPADVAEVLPWDTSGEVRRALEAVSPSLLVFTKTEVWPTLARLAAARGVRTALIAGTLPASSSRMGRVARRVLRPALARLDSVLAISEDDAARLQVLGARAESVEVTGDPGIDSAAARADAADPSAPYLAPFLAAPAPTVIAGSTWPADEAVLVPALTRVRDEVPELRVILAPHEPASAHLRSLGAALEAAGWQVSTLSAVETRASVGYATAVLVDRIGALADLYTVGNVAYVGGGFHAAGLHSVLEPAAARLPVAFGPRYQGSRAAVDLLEGDAGAVAESPGELAAVLERWLGDPAQGRSASAAAFGYVSTHLGAARRSADILASLLPPHRPPSRD